MLAAVDVTNVLDTLILALPAIIAAIYAGRVHKQIKTPSGKPLGAVAEYAHDTAIANNRLLALANGDTEPMTQATIHDRGSEPPQVPKEPHS